jgi:oxalate decarboxylase/phosphoglucose isomerase-like protein (cupin superfamily)
MPNSMGRLRSIALVPLALLMQLTVLTDARAAGPEENELSHVQDTQLNRSLFASIKPDADPIVVFGEPAGSKLEFLRTGKSTCGKYLFVKVTVPAGSGPPPHIHHWTDEWFYAPGGGIVMFHGTRRFGDIERPPDEAGKDAVTLMPLEKGQMAYGPREFIHGYTNATSHPVEVYIIWTPDTPDVSILGYFLSIYAPVFKDDGLNARFNSVQPIKAVAEAKKYGMNFSHDFWQYIAEVKYGGHTPDLHVEELKKLLKDGDGNCGK